MIDINNIEKVRETIRFARKQPLEVRKTFTRGLRTINRIKRNYKADVYLGPDWVEHSLYWDLSCLCPKSGLKKRAMNGGLILHGYQETFSVEVSPQSGPHWSIHT
jgi:hypothetical protein